MSNQSKSSFKDFIVLVLIIIGLCIGALFFFGVVVPIIAIIVQYVSLIVIVGLFIYGIYAAIFNKQF